MSENPLKNSYSLGDNFKEFNLSDEDFNDISERIFKLSGIVLRRNKQDMVYGRLARRLRALEISSFKEYRKFLDTPAGIENETQHFVNALTTNLTSFFREEHHFEHFRGYIQSIINENPKHPLRVWCSAASTGQEPYSIAMTLESLGISSLTHNIKVLCTDLDTNVLRTAEMGIYDKHSVEKLPAIKIKQYFSQKQNGEYCVIPTLKEFLIFKQLNLLSGWPMKGPFDAIFCRNVLIYFDQPTRAAIVQKMLNLLPTGGILYLGHSEAFPLPANLVASEGHTVFRKL